MLFLVLGIISIAVAGCAAGGGGGSETPTPTPSPNLPAIVGVTPSSGPLAGNTAIGIVGSSFAGATVTVGGRSAAGVAVNTEGTRIDCVVPAGQSPGAVDIVVTTAAGSSTSPIKFTYNAAPSISFMSPSAGPLSGGTNLTLLGGSFDGTVTVLIGGVAATSVAVSPDKNQITCVTPAGAAVGPNDVEIQASAAGSVRAPGGFTYTSTSNADPPAISSITPNRGPMTGGTTLVIFGARFNGNIAVTVGGRAATGISVNVARTQITCVTPAATTDGDVDVVVLSDRAGSATAVDGFTYNPAPDIAGITPLVGPQEGGTPFTLTGINFEGAITVTIGGRGATSLVVNAAKTQITGLTPSSGSTGPKDVVVRSDTHGVATLAGGFTYNGPPPTISRISPTTGPNRGGTLVTIDGANFRGTVTVSFGGVAATAVSVNSARTQLTCRTGAFTGTGTVDVTVKSSSHGSVTAASAFTYNDNPQPAITSITPDNGPLAGGTPVVIDGSNFSGAITVSFGGVLATGVTVNSARTRIDAVVPRGTAAGTVDVFLESDTHGGVTRTAGYTYNPPVSIASVFPSSGPKAGGTQILIGGSGFFNTLTVSIGSLPVSIVSVDPAGTVITARTTASPTTGTRNVTVTSSSHGTAVAVNAFTYTANPAPTVSSIVPDNGPLAGGTFVTVTGTNFEGNVTVTVGGASAGTASVNGDKTQLTFATPASALPGARDVVITSDTHGSVTIPGGFTYNPPPTITTVSPDNGPLVGGTPVTITGTNFGGTVSVKFGFFTATNVSVISPTQLTCTTPAGAAVAAVDVTVTSSTNGTVTKSGGFRYNPAPTLTTVTPDNGPLAGGTTVVLAGTNLGGTVNVTFGSTLATVIANATDGSSVTVLAPPGTAVGLVNISVFSSTNGPASKTNAYTYNPPPTVTSALSPNNGPLDGGTDVTVNGTGFSGTVNVTVGGQSAEVRSTNGSSQIVFRTPPGAAPVAVDVVITSSATGSVTVTGGFVYNPPVQIFDVQPETGPQAGGTTITIDGGNFFGTVGVTVGAIPATVTSVNTFHTRITAVTGASPDFGIRDVTVSSSSHGVDTIPNAFTYVPPLPTITNVSPSSGPLDGGTLVTITGTSFEGTVNVTFGTVAATQVSVDPSKTSLTCRTPPGIAPGAVNVILSSSTHGSATFAAGFSYNPRMTITAVTPNTGPVGGFNNIQIDGTNFLGNIQVAIGGNLLTAVSVTLGNTRITGTVPAGASAGTVPLVITSDTHGTVQSSYTYTNAPSINSVNPGSGPLAGNTTVDIAGSGFNGTVTVKIGDTFTSAPAATVVSVAPDGSSVRILTPPGASTGPKNVFVNSSTNGLAVRVNGFTYNSPPQATGVVPGDGKLAGGTPVIINGSGFLGTVTVQFGTVPATVLSVDTAGATISAITPPGTAAGLVDVRIDATAGGSTTLTNGFRYNPLPTVTAGVTPSEGPQDGGTPIAIAGSGFGGTVNVTVCGIPATNVTVNLTKTLINCRTAATTTPGLGDVVITSTSNGDITAPNAFTYNARPTLATIIPDNGPQAGFTPITVNGTGFRGTVTATIGGVAVTDLTVVNATQFTAKTPPSLTAGPRDLSITSSLNGTVNVTNAYTYNQSTVINTVTPSEGPLAGGTSVVISGQNFGGTVNVTFGSVPAVVTFQTLTQLNVVTPPGVVPGPVTVTVESSTSGIASAPGAFTYNAPMTIGTLNPNNGPLIGGTLVSMGGTNFVDVSTVSVDGAAVTSFTVNSATNITFRTPVGVFPGPVNVQVDSTTRGTVTGTGVFTYNPEPFILNVSPPEGPLFGGTNVTITGTNFDPPLTVKFGTLTAQTLSATQTQIVVLSPPTTSPGAVAVTVESGPNGPFSIFPGFTYNATPSIGVINPNNGPKAGGNAVVITGSGFDGSTTVLIGGRNVTVTAISPDRTTINGIVPPSAVVGAVDVNINSIATGNTTLTGGYTYNPPITVTQIQPPAGPVTGGTLMTIDGTNLFGPPNVTINGVAGLGITTGNTGTRVQLTTPSSAVTGTFDVVITSSAFGSFVATGAFTYNDVCTLAAITPDTGTVQGNTTVNITGTGLFNSQVFFGGQSAANVTVNTSGTVITCKTPGPTTPGQRDVRVTTLANGEATLVNGYTYVPDFTSSGFTNTGNTPLGMAVKDVNGDGKADVAISNQLDNNVILLFNITSPGGIPTLGSTGNVTFATGGEPTGIAVADLDNDGIQDVVTANKLTNDLTVLVGLTAPGGAAPTFTALAPIANTGGPSALVADDFNGDGKIDVAVTSELSSFLRVRINTTTTPGSVTLGGAVQTFGTGLAPVAMISADLNGDGKPDLATANKDSNSISIIRNNCVPGSATPAFSNVATISLPANSSPQGLAAADFNGDGRLDLVVANSVGANLTVFLNTTTDSSGNPSFGTGAVFPASGAPAGVQAVDIDLDGRADIISSNDSGNNVSFRLCTTAPNATTATFSGRTDLASGTGPRAIRVIDMNGNGRPEIVIANRLSNQVHIFEHVTGLGTIPSAFSGRTDFGAGVGPLALSPGDINRDGKLDLLVANETSNDFSVKINNTTPGAITFEFLALGNITTGVPNSGPAAIAAVDIDGDGRLDAVVSNRLNSNIRAHLNQTTAGSTSISFGTGFGFGFPLSTPAGLAVGDVTMDGRPDVLVAQRGATRLALLRNTSIFNSGAPAFATLNVTSGAGPRGAAIGDLNGDGKNDIVSADGSSSTITVTLNQTAAGGSGPFVYPTGTTFPVDLNPAAVAIFDFNGDGRQDIVTANQGASNVTVYRNTTAFGATTPSFSNRAEFGTTTGPTAIFIQDVNGDGKPDIVTANQGSNRVSVLLNTSGLGGAVPAFPSRTDVTVGNGPEGVAVGDFNGDGRPDVAAACKASSVVSVLRNVTTP